MVEQANVGAPPTQSRGVQPSSSRVELPAVLSVNQLAQALGASPIDVIKQLMRQGIMANINQVIDFSAAALAARALGHEPVPQAEAESATGSVRVREEESAQLVVRPPVVTILGHVDHGKTTLLDAIRKTKVAASEVGGITQHIGAYQVEYRGQRIAFLDTPGHEAFTAMRARGAQATDIAVLVVAADDGVMPQTVEAIDHARAAGVPIIAAINKIDKPGADIEKVKRQLMEHGLVTEELGGDVIAVPVSAKAGKGISDLLESILVVAEVAELKANPDREAIGVVVEARLDKSKGPLATVLVQTGTLNVGDNVAVGGIRGRVKAMLTDAGKRVKQAGPSTPVEIMGLAGLPQAGDRLVAVPDERTAREMAEQYQRQAEAQRARAPTLEEVVAQIRAGQVKELNIIVKTDVQGSIEAMRSALERVGTEKARVKLIHAAAGSITESDVLLATASKAIIVGFNTRPEPGARTLAETAGVDIRYYDIIYKLAEDVQAALEGLLEPTYADVVEGRAEVRALFPAGRERKVAGCYVTEGRIARSAPVRVMRNGVALFDGAIRGLRRFKEDVREVSAGYECGVLLEGFNDFQEGDVLEAHRQQQTGKSA